MSHDSHPHHTFSATSSLPASLRNERPNGNVRPLRFERQYSNDTVGHSRDSEARLEQAAVGRQVLQAFLAMRDTAAEEHLAERARDTKSTQASSAQAHAAAMNGLREVSPFVASKHLGQLLMKSATSSSASSSPAMISPRTDTIATPFVPANLTPIAPLLDPLAEASAASNNFGRPRTPVSMSAARTEAMEHVIDRARSTGRQLTSDQQERAIVAIMDPFATGSTIPEMLRRRLDEKDADAEERREYHTTFLEAHRRRTQVEQDRAQRRARRSRLLNEQKEHRQARNPYGDRNVLAPRPLRGFVIRLKDKTLPSKALVVAQPQPRPMPPSNPHIHPSAPSSLPSSTSNGPTGSSSSSGEPSASASASGPSTSTSSTSPPPSSRLRTRSWVPVATESLTRPSLFDRNASVPVSVPVPLPSSLAQLAASLVASGSGSGAGVGVGIGFGGASPIDHTHSHSLASVDTISGTNLPHPNQATRLYHHQQQALPPPPPPPSYSSHPPPTHIPVAVRPTMPTSPTRVMTSIAGTGTSTSSVNAAAAAPSPGRSSATSRLPHGHADKFFHSPAARHLQSALTGVVASPVTVTGANTPLSRVQVDDLLGTYRRSHRGQLEARMTRTRHWATQHALKQALKLGGGLVRTYAKASIASPPPKSRAVTEMKEHVVRRAIYEHAAAAQTPNGVTLPNSIGSFARHSTALPTERKLRSRSASPEQKRGLDSANAADFGSGSGSDSRPRSRHDGSHATAAAPTASTDDSTGDAASTQSSIFHSSAHVNAQGQPIQDATATASSSATGTGTRTSPTAMTRRSLDHSRKMEPTIPVALKNSAAPMSSRIRTSRMTGAQNALVDQASTIPLMTVKTFTPPALDGVSFTAKYQPAQVTISSVYDVPISPRASPTDRNASPSSSHVSTASFPRRAALGRRAMSSEASAHALVNSTPTPSLGAGDEESQHAVGTSASRPPSSPSSTSRRTWFEMKLQMPSLERKQMIADRQRALHEEIQRKRHSHHKRQHKRREQSRSSLPSLTPGSDIVPSHDQTSHTNQDDDHGGDNEQHFTVTDDEANDITGAADEDAHDQHATDDGDGDRTDYDDMRESPTESPARSDLAPHRVDDTRVDHADECDESSRHPHSDLSRSNSTEVNNLAPESFSLEAEPQSSPPSSLPADSSNVDQHATEDDESAQPTSGANESL